MLILNLTVTQRFNSHVVTDAGARRHFCFVIDADGAADEDNNKYIGN